MRATDFGFKAIDGRRLDNAIRYGIPTIKHTVGEKNSVTSRIHMRLGYFDGLPPKFRRLFVWCLTALSAQIGYIVPYV